MARINLSQFGALLDLARGQRGHRLKDVARELGFSTQTVTDVRKYPLPHAPTQKLLAALAEYIGWTQENILTALDTQEEPCVITYPLATRAGIQYAPPIPQRQTSCTNCKHFAPCCVQVYERDGFAICESLIPADILPPLVAAVVARNYQEDRYGIRTLA